MFLDTSQKNYNKKNDFQLDFDILSFLAVYSLLIHIS